MSDTAPTPPEGELRFDRKKLLKAGAAAAAAPTVAGIVAPRARADHRHGAPAEALEEATIAELQRAMERGRLDSLSLVRGYLRRIQALDRHGPKLNSILELNPDAEKIARDLDRERADGRVRGPLHGIPIVLKGNIDTADKMMTTAGSLALVGAAPVQDSTVAANLRQAGAVILGKTNLSEWANFRSFHSSSGWSGQGGQTRNPYVLDRNPCGSSSGSGVAAAASLAAASLGTETDGSIVCPATANDVVGLKPSVGLVSRAGVVPISDSQDTVGPHSRTVADAAAVLGALTGVDPRDPATAASAGNFHTDYTRFLDPNGLRGARIGVTRAGVTGYSEETDEIYEEAIQAIRDAGATVLDPVDIPTIDRIGAGAEEITVLIYEFKRDLNAYLATRVGVPIRTLADAIQFNLDHAEVELKWFLQEWFDIAEARLDIASGDGSVITDAEYIAARDAARRLGGPEGIDAALGSVTPKLDALIAPTGSPMWPIDLVNGDHFLGASSSAAAIAGYPLINVPAGHAFGLPVGITFMGTKWSEPTLIKLASGFEHATQARKTPRFIPTLPLDGPGRPRRRRRKKGEKESREHENRPSLI